MTRAITGMLFGISPADPATLIAVVLTMLALRAARIEPMQVLRDE